MADPALKMLSYSLQNLAKIVKFLFGPSTPVTTDDSRSKIPTSMSTCREAP